jgi:hypothetical protein
MPTIINKAEVRKQVRDASDTMVKGGGDTAAASRKAALEASDGATGEAVRRTMEATSHKVDQKSAETAEQRLQKGAEALRNAEVQRNSATRSTEAVGNAAAETRQAAGQAVEQLGQVSAMQARAFQEVTGRTQQSLGTMMQAGIKLSGGFQSVMREWADYTRNAIQCNVDGMNGIMRARTLPDLMAAQSKLLNAEVQLMLTSSARISQETARVARDAAQSIGERAQQRDHRDS